MRRVALALVALLVVAAPALGDDITKKKHVDLQIGSLNDKLARQQQQEQALKGRVAGYTARIRALEARVGDVSLRLGTLEADLALHQRRLGVLDALFRLQTERLRYLQVQYRDAVATLERRFVELYESDQTTTLDVVLDAQNLQDALDEVQYIKQVAAQDKRIADSVGAAKQTVHASRQKTTALRSTVRGETAVISARTAQVRSVRDELVGATNDLGVQRRKSLVDLSQLTASERAEASEIDALQAASAALAIRIRSAQAHSSGRASETPSSAGLIWPVDGPITSPFGWRWGRMHQGIDIGVPDGTPIHAAAAGTVIYCGWEEGYGNLVVLDNGGNLSTAYAHQSAIAVACGQVVAQGDVIGYVGCTGHCTGPHLHFEVRVDGNPVDPLGYLP
jgi:murein DD-endopeptidase MepM/ murein hydrolase activator NlpD